MTKLALLAIAALTLTLSTGCTSSKKSGRAKETSAIAQETEATFRQRWTDKRSAELTSQGTTAGLARAQAETEFRQKFGFNENNKK
jgi:1,2-phenylacetyl-CoA epoxidase catalytic subunit